MHLASTSQGKGFFHEGERQTGFGKKRRLGKELRDMPPAFSVASEMGP